MPRVAVAASSKISADAGATVASQGGNAVDAALASALVSLSTDLGIVALGASGFITIWPPGGHPVVIDAYAEVPGRAVPPERLNTRAREVCFDYGGGISTLVGHRSVATPGIVAGLGMAAAQYGALPWATVVAPVRQWAEQGFPLTSGSAEYLAYTHEAIFGWHPESYQALHHVDGSCLKPGEIVHLRGLGDSLRIIAGQGADVFYTGVLGQRIAAEVQANQGLLTAADLAAYQSIGRSPTRLQFCDWEIVTNPPPAIGGPCLAAMLLLLNHQPARSRHTPVLQQLIDIQHAVLHYRSQHLDGIRDCSPEAAQLLELAAYGDRQPLIQSPSTIHISTVDSNGLACSISASAGYGSGVMVPGTGFWLNNSLGELDLHPHGLQSFPPGTRLTSNMAPTIARRADGAVLAIGSPGASRITTAIAQVLLNFVHSGLSLPEAIARPRLHVEVFEGLPTVACEPDLPVPAMAGWVTRQFPSRSMYFGGVQAALWEPTTGLSAVADPRRNGATAQGGMQSI